MGGFWDSLWDSSGSSSSGSSWLEPVLNVGSKLVDTYLRDDNRGEIEDILRAREDRNYQEGLANYNAYNEYLKAYEGASAANRAASARNAQARAAAAAREHQNMLAAAKQGMRVANKHDKRALAMMQPYVDAGAATIPKMTETYGKALGGMNSAFDYVSSPAQMAKLEQDKAAWNTGVPIPSYLMGRRA